ncbi:histidine kinase [Ideonella sp. 4Y11]|uniref:Histidine kinase n=1 Tax=Ideonella aquatica TaxID=2824119 RepID=A0A941BI05_9BURK|nr:histidine kinase [Ideonella aquatica]MBQ0961451.1 histidine kinase [Ideonella aquatica]
MVIDKNLLRRSWRAWTDSGMTQAGPVWLQWVWSLLFAMLVALVFTLIAFATSPDPGRWTSGSAWRRTYFLNLLVSAVVATGIHLSFDVMTGLIGPARWKSWSDRRRAWVATAIAMGGTAWSWPLGVWLAGYRLTWFDGGGSPTNVSISWLIVLVLVSGLHWLYLENRRRIEAAERHAAEARLKLLQGQIEPHFLFNTLANVLSLLEADPPRARGMLEAFVDYLRSSFGGLRAEQHTLADEQRLLEAYLRVLGLRMDERLRWQIDIPAELAALPLPPLLLQPLVENAIHHGLEPKVEGGTVGVRAQRQHDTLVLSVSDDGLGLNHPAPRRPGQRSALQNLRERLQQAWGDQASLQLLPEPTGGVRAEIRLPCPTVQP